LWLFIGKICFPPSCSRLIRTRVLYYRCRREAAPVTHQDQGFGYTTAVAPALFEGPENLWFPAASISTADYAAYKLMASDFRLANMRLARDRGVFAQNRVEEAANRVVWFYQHYAELAPSTQIFMQMPAPRQMASALLVRDSRPSPAYGQPPWPRRSCSSSPVCADKNPGFVRCSVSRNVPPR